VASVRREAPCAGARIHRGPVAVLTPVQLFFSIILRRPRSTLFPYTTLFRSLRPAGDRLREVARRDAHLVPVGAHVLDQRTHHEQDRKSTRLNSSHVEISYAVFCLKKKNARDEDFEFIAVR